MWLDTFYGFSLVFPVYVFWHWGANNLLMNHQGPQYHLKSTLFYWSIKVTYFLDGLRVSKCAYIFFDYLVNYQSIHFIIVKQNKIYSLCSFLCIFTCNFTCKPCYWGKKNTLWDLFWSEKYPLISSHTL